MTRLNQAHHLLFILIISSFIQNSTAEEEQECKETSFVLSSCNEHDKTQWLIKVPKTNDSCVGKTIEKPRNIPCNFACPEGQAIHTEKMQCIACRPGFYSIGSGQEYLFRNMSSLTESDKIILEGSSLVKGSNSYCNKENVWSIKNNVLQGEIQMNCALGLFLKFKLERAGLINITYSLPTSFIFVLVKSRCDLNSAMEFDGDIDVSNDDAKRIHASLHTTGYGNWSTKTIVIPESGEYSLQLYGLGLSSFPFPFSIRSIVIKGTTYLNKCNPCPPGTFSNSSESSSCKTCPPNTYSSKEGSSKCEQCDSDTEYADETKTSCKKRRDCEKSDYRKVFVKCDEKNMAQFRYDQVEPKICRGSFTSENDKPISCGTCNPGTFKTKSMTCEFCPNKTYSDGTLSSCLSCPNDLSLVTGLYYKYWNELPKYFKSSFLSPEDEITPSPLSDAQSWIPSVSYIYSQPMINTLSVLSLTIDKGFQETDIAKTNKVYGNLYFNFSVECKQRCIFLLFSQDIYDDDFTEWTIIHKWKLNETSTHGLIHDYTHKISYPDPVIFNWLFISESELGNTDEARIYEIRVTNTKIGGSDRCISCLTVDNKETECKSCSPGHILANNTCVRCPERSIAVRSRATDLVMNKCEECPINMNTNDGVTCSVPCTQSFDGNILYNLSSISTIQFQGPKLFTQKGSGYYHLFNAKICGETDVVCTRTPSESENKRLTNQMQIQSKLCRMGVVPITNKSLTAVAYVDDFGENLVEISLKMSTKFPSLRSDYNLTDITLVYQTNTRNSDTNCPERITYLSLRCDHDITENQDLSNKNYTLQTPTSCVTGTCDGCHFYFLLRTPLACPVCEQNEQGYRIFEGICKFGRQEIRHVPHPYCSHILEEKIQFRKCSIFTVEIEILIGIFLLTAIALIGVVLLCWRKNRKLEYRYMQLIENVNPDDDQSVDNVCAQLSEEDDEAEEVHFKQSKTKKMLNVVRNAIGRKSNNSRSDRFDRDSFLLTNQSTNDA